MLGFNGGGQSPTSGSSWRLDLANSGLQTHIDHHPSQQFNLLPRQLSAERQK
jgi:hypothetical protein